MTEETRHQERRTMKRPPSWAVIAVLLGATLTLGAVAHRSGDAPAPKPILPTPVPVTPLSSGPVKLTTHLDRSAVMQGSDGVVKLELVLRADEMAALDAARLPTDLTVVFDRSGSMGGEKIARARQAVRALIDELQDGDRFALVTYSDGAELPVPLQPVTSERRATWRALLPGIAAAGNTNMSGGIDLALSTLRDSQGAAVARASRIVVISDGQANRGDSSQEGLVARGTQAARAEHVMSSVGVGLGFNEFLMAGLAGRRCGQLLLLARR